MTVWFCACGELLENRESKCPVCYPPEIKPAFNPEILIESYSLNRGEAVINLKLSLIGADNGGDKRHAEEIMKSLGITYERAVPQSIADQWLFFDCKNVPEKLPEFITAFSSARMKL